MNGEEEARTANTLSAGASGTFFERECITLK